MATDGAAESKAGDSAECVVHVVLWNSSERHSVVKAESETVADAVRRAFGADFMALRVVDEARGHPWLYYGSAGRPLFNDPAAFVRHAVPAAAVAGGAADATTVVFRTATMLADAWSYKGEPCHRPDVNMMERPPLPVPVPVPVPAPSGV